MKTVKVSVGQRKINGDQTVGCHLGRRGTSCPRRYEARLPTAFSLSHWLFSPSQFRFSLRLLHVLHSVVARYVPSGRGMPLPCSLHTKALETFCTGLQFGSSVWVSLPCGVRGRDRLGHRPVGTTYDVSPQASSARGCFYGKKHPATAGLGLDYLPLLGCIPRGGDGT